MTLLDDAKRLATFSAADRDGACVFGCGRGLNTHHARDCPWLNMPRIVAALEVFERVLAMFVAGFMLDDDGRPTVWACENCGGTGRTRDAVEHSVKCRIGKMVAALRGNDADDPV